MRRPPKKKGPGPLARWAGTTSRVEHLSAPLERDRKLSGLLPLACRSLVGLVARLLREVGGTPLVLAVDSVDRVRFVHLLVQRLGVDLLRDLVPGVVAVLDLFFVGQDPSPPSS